MSHWSDDPLGQEYGQLHSEGFSKADLAEIARAMSRPLLGS